MAQDTDAITSDAIEPDAVDQDAVGADTIEQDTADLAGMVDQLLAEVSSAPAGASSPNNADPSTPPGALDEVAPPEDAAVQAQGALDEADHSVEELADQVDALLEGLSAFPSVGEDEPTHADPGADPPVSDPPIADQPDDDQPVIAEPVIAEPAITEAVVAEPVEASADRDQDADEAPDAQEPSADASVPKESAAPVVDIESLDEQLAETTDGLIAAAEQIEPSPQPDASPAPVPSTAEQAAPHDGPTDDAAPSHESPTHESSAPTDPAEQPIAPPASVTPSRPAKRIGKANAAAQRIATVARTGYARAEPAALRGAVLVSSPLANRPRIIRDTVGWIGLWTLFLAICVWFTLAFLRSAAPPEIDAEPTALAEPE